MPKQEKSIPLTAQLTEDEHLLLSNILRLIDQNKYQRKYRGYIVSTCTFHLNVEHGVYQNFQNILQKFNGALLCPEKLTDPEHQAHVKQEESPEANS